jgi:hypothetical protein
VEQLVARYLGGVRRVQRRLIRGRCPSRWWRRRRA